MRRSNSFPLFLLSCLIAFVLVLLGLRIYFDQSRLDQHLSYTLSGKQFVVLTGQAIAQSNNSLKVQYLPEKKSAIALDGIDVSTDIFDTMQIQFQDKPSQQSLLLRVNTTDGVSKTIPILYTDKAQISQFFLSDLAASGATITGLSLSTNKLIDDYTLNSVVFDPKPMSTLRLLYLMGHDMGQAFDADTDYKNYYLLPAYQLILLYFGCVLVLYFLFLCWTRRTKVTAWWVTLLFAWIVIDAAYIYQYFSTTPLIFANIQGWFVAIFSLSPWLLGSIISVVCLKRRYGYLPLALGSGYLVGAVLIVIVLLLAKQYQWQLNWPVIWVTQALLAVVLIYFLRPQRCSIEELRLEKAPTNSDYFLSLLFILAAIIHVVVMANHWVSVFSNADSLSQFSLTQAGDWLLTYLQQVADASAVLVVLTTGAFIGLGLLLFGGLRYAGVGLLPAVAASYVMLSLPLWYQLGQTVLGYSEIFSLFAYSAVMIVLALMVCYREYRLVVLLVFAIIALAANSESYTLLLQGKLAVSVQQSTLQYHFIDNHFFAAIFARSYLLVPAVLGSMIVWLICRGRDNEINSIRLLLFFSIVTLALFGWASLMMFSDSDLVHIGWLDSSLVLLVTAMVMVPCCIYQLITKDDETIPTI